LCYLQPTKIKEKHHEIRTQDAAEGYVSVSANFGKPAVEQVAVKGPAAPEVAFNAIPVPARKPAVRQ
jgi:hypothetical protein